MHIGIDLGGTNTAAAIVDKDGKILERVGIATTVYHGSKSVIDGLIAVCEMLMKNKKTGPDTIGIGVPGIVDDTKGEVVFTPNLPLKEINITHELQKKYGCPVHLGNDANCAALGEAAAGGAKGAKDAIFITLGTGLGGGIILGGRLHTGINGAAGELGHIVIIRDGRECGCGRRGCWERYASAGGLTETAKENMIIHKDSLLWNLCGGQTGKTDGRMVFDAYRMNDPAAALTVTLYIKHLAAGITSIINILQPEIVCIGGGISNAWDCIAEPLNAAVDAEKITRFFPNAKQTRIVKAELGNDAGIIGAALLGI